ncbi:MAG TPA: S26 family signal peptidase [Spirochaetota bacterium]|nr:S26 family signal peptidase [Spirochaetota bacterium]HPC42571.1 S26 family signal peptidase [Spirochaetota bacterium]HPL15525.1 S26 family signal peptidase [Spirochaetota bacterium]HQF10141.1 S26 family signal peptidase [Spirochaetota bacterium]HQH98925.1 S26 family signal peptidase [Spirochaetota bacterium]
MTDNIIQTQKREARSPGAAFALSLFFTGLGQMYNGDLAKGAVFLLLRTAALLAAPAAMVTRDPLSGIIPFICLGAAALAITIASPVEALVRARTSQELPVRRYNSAIAHGVYVLLASIITAVLLLVLAAFFNTGEVTDRRGEPLLERGDIVLLYRYAPNGYRRGDLVFLRDGSVGRIMALPGDMVRYDKNIFYVNGRALPLGYLPDDVIGRFSKNRSDVLSETNDTRKYPVRFRQSPEVTLRVMPLLVARGNLLVAADSRVKKDFARTVMADDIYGRVEGVLYSSYIRRIGKDACGNLK